MPMVKATKQGMRTVMMQRGRTDIIWEYVMRNKIAKMLRRKAHEFAEANPHMNYTEHRRVQIPKTNHTVVIAPFERKVYQKLKRMYKDFMRGN